MNGRTAGEAPIVPELALQQWVACSWWTFQGPRLPITSVSTRPILALPVNQTEFINSIAGWQDLTGIGLKRVGLYYSVQLDTYAGPAKAGSEHNDLAYDVSLAKTWTDPDVLLIGNFTTFAEFYATSYLDGSKHGQTVVNATPGIRLTLGHGNVLMGGVDLPVSTPHAFDATYRLTYIYNF